MKSILLIGLFIVMSFNLFSGDIDSLRREGRKSLEGKNYKNAITMYETILKDKNSNLRDLLILVSAATLDNNYDIAFKYLDKGFEKEIESIYNLIEEDEELAVLHKDSRWNSFMEKMKQKLDKMLSVLPDSHQTTKLVDLPEPLLDGKISLEKALAERRSVRKYAPEPLTLQDVSQILWSAYGVTKPQEKPAFLRGGMKTAPSAGARYPLELYIVAGNVKDLPAGIYQYKSETHQLSLITTGDKRKELCDASWEQMMVEEAPCSVVYSAVYSRTTNRYGQRGRDRYVCMDLGHSAENIYLQCETLGLGTCAIGSFIDNKIKTIVNMTKEEEPLYVMPVGKIVE